MTTPTHVIVGLILGKLTGNYTASLAGSLLIDADHLISYYKSGILFKPKELLKATTTEEDPWGDQRNILHSLVSWIIISLILCLIHLQIGLIISLAYFLHLVLDALDSADFFPLFPKKIFNIKGPVKYFSLSEILLMCVLIGVFFVI